MELTRRDLLTWGGGATAGLLLTPLPWKVLDDTSKWTQNWPWIPQPSRAPIEVKRSFCTLCPNGCDLRVRVASGTPVGVSPGPQSALCPLAFGAHQLNWHPGRLRQVSHLGKAASWNDALAAFRKAAVEGPIAVVDAYPRRAGSSVMENFARRQGGTYCIILSAEERSLAPYAAWSGAPVTSLGYDFEHARTILSFGAPLLDGWGAPGRVPRLWSTGALKLIQVEPSLSRTANAAWRWIQVPSGSEAALAAGLARVLLEEHISPARAPLPPTTVAEAAAQTGIAEETIRELARTLAAHGPAVAIAADGDPAVAVLNFAVGSIGARGGIVRRREGGPSYLTADNLNGHFRAVLIDATVPWDFAPQADAEVFRFAAWNGGGSRAHWLLPAPGFLEELTDVPTAPGSAVDTYAIAANLSTPPADVRSPAGFLAQVDSALPSVEDIIHARCRELFRTHTGALQGEETVPVSRFAAPERLEEALRTGSVWVAGPPRSGGLRCRFEQWPQPTAPRATADWTATWVPPVLPPLAVKLYRESSLREPPAGRSI